MTIAKKIENTPILPNFNKDPFFGAPFVPTMNIYPNK